MQTQIYTYFTPANNETRLIHTAEDWTKIRVQLETAGPVAVGTLQDIAPVLSGKGMQLITNVPREIVLSPGTRFYVVAGTINRINVVVESIPFLADIRDAINGLRAALSRGPGPSMPGSLKGCF